MKAVILATMMVFLSFVLFCSLSWYIEYDHTQNTIEMAMKRALMSTMVDFVDEDELDFEIYDVLASFEGHFRELALSNLHYKIALIGFIKEPLFISVEVQASDDSKLRGLNIHVKEAMIEELKNEEE